MGRARVLVRHLPSGSDFGEPNEDCLHLNVWTPAGPGRTGPRPVLVWLYGGAFEAGSASPPATDGAALARLTGTVVVAANYRVGALGFLHLADLGGEGWAGCTNLGLQDQVAALCWVQANIAAFGGGPGNITLAGEFAGAFAVGTLLALPQAAGTFHKGILQSGSTSRVCDRDIANAIAHDFLDALELDHPVGLRDVPVERILEAQGSVVDRDFGHRNLPGGRFWGPVLDGTVLSRLPHLAVREGAAVSIPLLVGVNRDEARAMQVVAGASFGPRDEAALCAEVRSAGVTEPDKLVDAYRRRTGETDLGALRSVFLTDVVCRLLCAQLSQAQVETGGRAHHYVFLDEPLGPQMGAFHSAPMFYVFDKLPRLDSSSPDRVAVLDQLADAWATFAATGDPGWPVYDAAAEGNARAFGGPGGAIDGMVTEPPADDVLALGTGAEPVTPP